MRAGGAACVLVLPLCRNELIAGRVRGQSRPPTPTRASVTIYSADCSASRGVLLINFHFDPEQLRGSPLGARAGWGALVFGLYCVPACVCSAPASRRAILVNLARSAAPLRTGGSFSSPLSRPAVIIQTEALPAGLCCGHRRTMYRIYSGGRLPRPRPPWAPRPGPCGRAQSAQVYHATRTRRRESARGAPRHSGRTRAN